LQLVGLERGRKKQETAQIQKLEEKIEFLKGENDEF